MVKQYIASFNVSVNFLCVVQILKAFEYSLAYASNFCLIEVSLSYLDYVSYTTRVTVFENKPQIIILHVAAIVLDYVRTLAFL